MKPNFRTLLYLWWRWFTAWMMENPPNPYVLHGSMTGRIRRVLHQELKS